MDFLTMVVNKIIGWIDNLFKYFEAYSGGYSKMLVYGLILFILSKFVKLKVDVKTGNK